LHASQSDSDIYNPFCLVLSQDSIECMAPANVGTRTS
jgi:hypothetical protein